jgi:hypothetical protein
MTGDSSCPINPLATHVVYAKVNMETISKMTPIDISITTGTMENVFIEEDCSPQEIQIYTDLFKEFCDVFSWSYEEIAEHEITTYPDTKSVK